MADPKFSFPWFIASPKRTFQKKLKSMSLINMSTTIFVIKMNKLVVILMNFYPLILLLWSKWKKKDKKINVLHNEKVFNEVSPSTGAWHTLNFKNYDKFHTCQPPKSFIPGDF